MANPIVAPVMSNADLVLVGLLLTVAALFGGSSVQGLDGHLILQCVGAIALTVGIAIGRPVPVSRTAWVALTIVLTTLIVGLLQLVPVPMDMASGSAREVTKNAWTLLGMETGSMGLSLAPSETFSAILAFIPPVAVFVLVATSRWSRTIEPVCWLLIALGALSALLGIAQLYLGPESPLYLYGRSGLPVGFFSNPNHQASFLLLIFPLSLAMLVQQQQSVRSRDSEIGVLIASLTLFLTILVGIISTGSVAGLALLTAVVPLSLALFVKRRKNKRSVVLPILFLAATLLGVAATLASPLLPGSLWGSQAGEAARPAIWARSMAIAMEHLPFGTGLGSFEFVYPLYETEDGLTNRYMNAAHNDYLQTFVELGLPGAVLIVLSLGLWAILTVRTWAMKGQSEVRLRKAASIALLVVILHSLIDYPLRAPLYATVAATLLAMMAAPERHARRRKDETANEKRVTL